MYLVASHLGLINVDLELATELGGATLKQSKENFLKVHKRLSDGLSEIDHEDFDLILLTLPIRDFSEHSCVFRAYST